VPISVFELFSVGIGPSSSHTVGPMRAARTFVSGLAEDGLLGSVTAVRAELFGSLGATGHGHGSHRAVLLGLAGEEPETVDTDAVADLVDRIRASRAVSLLGKHEIAFDPDADLVLHRRKSLPFHPNGMRFRATGPGVERERTYYSVGGGFVVTNRRRARTASWSTTPRSPTRSAPAPSCSRTAGTAGSRSAT